MESFIIIRKGNVAIPVGRYGAGDKEYAWEMSPPSTPQPTDLFQGQHSREVGRVYFWLSGVQSKSSAHFLQRRCRDHGAIAVEELSD